MRIKYLTTCKRLIDNSLDVLDEKTLEFLRNTT